MIELRGKSEQLTDLAGEKVKVTGDRSGMVLTISSMATTK
jgi:hypothetical protein